jgi:hypothetical protein
MDNLMNAIDSTLKVPIPRLQPDEIKGLQDFWEVYESHRSEVTAQLLHMASEHSEFKFILQNAPTQQSAEQEQTSRKLQQRAIKV